MARYRTGLIAYVSFEALETFLIGADADSRKYIHTGTEHRVHVGAIAKRCNVDPETVYRWRTAGRIPWYTADEVAIRLGVHPLVIWPEFTNAQSELCTA